MIGQYLDILLHLDKYLQMIVGEYSTLTYVILFTIIFLETGVVVTPFLPGDSLLFAAGALAATGSFNVSLLFLVLFLAAVLGDTINYHLGKYIGPKVFTNESSLFFQKQHLLRAQEFYDKHGRKTIILARFIPFIRTFAPFVAGIGKMSYSVFLMYNIIGALAWCGLFVFGGYLFGNIPFVQENFGMFVLGIIIVSLLPLLKELAVYFYRLKYREMR
ncbi:DedA family protein [Candidatus Woesearchaeota archaeon]|nr:DedA family protein [Candidatus Woesearchaeota archaeon]